MIEELRADLLALHRKPLIVSPGQATKDRAYHVIGAQKYRTTGVPTHLPYWMLASMGLRQAKARLCEEIVVEVAGMRSRRFSVSEVEEYVRKHPQTTRGLAW